MTVTTRPDKVRGWFKPITFNIDQKRNVTQSSKAVDTLKANKIKGELKSDNTVITSISQAITSGSVTQKDIIQFCAQQDSFGERKIKKMLKKYTSNAGTNPSAEETSTDGYSPIWRKTKGDKHSYIFSAIKPRK